MVALRTPVWFERASELSRFPTHKMRCLARYVVFRGPRMSVRDLFYTSGDKIEEAESLDDAMCILHARRSSLKRRPTAIQRTTDFDYLRGA